MKAAVVTEYGTPEYKTFEDPVAAEGQAVLEVKAAGINPIDLAVASGAIPPLMPELPAVPGFEAVGLLDGRRVYSGGSIRPYGSMAEYTLVDPETVFDVPDELDDATAVAIGIAGLAAWLPLANEVGLETGDHVLVLGATGIVGQVAVQAARLLGAGRVVAAARSEEGEQIARDLGADAFVRIGDDVDELAEGFRQATDNRLDIILDPLWGSPAAAALQAATMRARLIQIGNSAGPMDNFDPGSLRGRVIQILGFSGSAVPKSVARAAYADMTALAGEGKLRIKTEIIPLSEVEDAWARQRSSPHRKLVLKP